MISIRSTPDTYRGRMDPLPFDADAINAMQSELSPITRVQCLEVSSTHALAVLEALPDSLRPGGFVSGPTQFALVDAALWYVTFGAIGRIEPMALTSELSIRYLRPAVGARVYCRADLEAVNRRSVIATAHVWCDHRSDKITATAQGTYAIPLPR
jgi:acyl-coenzyme A thioesterase PaaI-like protein